MEPQSRTPFPRALKDLRILRINGIDHMASDMLKSVCSCQVALAT
jgi:hypothetical protein